jgi:uncharacterized protein (DUF433 family)
MHLEDYFEFLAPDDIRIKGTRIGIETILTQYLHQAQTPEEIKEGLRTVTLERVYATILYYLHNREAVSGYLADYLENTRQTRDAAAQDPSPARQRLLQIKAQLATYPPDQRDEALKRILAEEKAMNEPTAPVA